MEKPISVKREGSIARTVTAPQQVDRGGWTGKKGSSLSEMHPRGARGQERTWAEAGARPEEGQPRPSPAPSGRPSGEPEAGRKRRPGEVDLRQSSARKACRGPSLSGGASGERSATRPGAMATPRRWPRVVPGPSLGWLLLLLSALFRGRASLRLLDFPALVCSQEVSEAGRSEDAGAVGWWWGGRRRVVKRSAEGGEEVSEGGNAKGCQRR